MSGDFLTEKNEAMLQRVLYSDICRRTGGDLNEKQASRLMKTVKHYMGEVYKVHGPTGASVPILNKEVLTITLNDYMSYMNRSNRGTMADLEQGPPVPLSREQQSSEKLMIANKPATEYLDVSTAFSQLQDARQQTKAKPPSVPDFRMSLENEAPVSLDYFEKIKQEREQEAKRQAEQIDSLMKRSNNTNIVQAGDSFLRDKRKADEEAEQLFAERERKRLEQRIQQEQTNSSIFSKGEQALTTLPEPPDMKALFLGNNQVLNRSAGNATLAQPTSERLISSRQETLIVREPESVTYKETELNLFVYSADRDWTSINTSESRYNFTVNFDTANFSSGLRVSPTSTFKFKNITRIELVKAIMPGEGLDMLVTKSSTTAYDSSLNMNLLSFPYVQVRIPELDTNTYGTNSTVNSSFGVLQYDANWIYDTSNTTARGYLAMIPKFLKSQKVYTPTPLSTLQKLSFRFERPDGTLLSTTKDTLDINQIIPSLAVNATIMTAGGAVTGTNYITDNTVDVSGSAYYWLKTSTYFNHWMVTKGDRIQMKNLTWGTAATGNELTQLTDILNYLQDEAGLFVVGTGVVTGSDPSTWVFTDGYNKQGYANAILVRGKFIDPSISGGLLPTAPGGIVDSYTSGLLSYYLTNTSLTAGRLINLSHQVQVVLRVIVREMDSTGILRPDNLY